MDFWPGRPSRLLCTKIPPTFETPARLPECRRIKLADARPGGYDIPIVPGTRPKKYPAGTFQIGCALIIGRRNEQTDLKTSLNDVLREYEIGS